MQLRVLYNILILLALSVSVYIHILRILENKN